MIFRDKDEWSLGIWLSILICDRRGVLEVAGSMSQDHVSHKYPLSRKTLLPHSRM